jgi:hypothetical protein
MTYSTIRDLVHERSGAQGYGQHDDLRAVTVRIESYRVEELDLLARYLGFSSRQQLTATLLSTAIDDALHELSEALSGDPEHHAQFTSDRIGILEEPR